MLEYIYINYINIYIIYAYNICDPLATSELAYRGEFVTLRDIAFVHKKRKVTREEKLAQAKVRIHSLNPHKCCVQM